MAILVRARIHATRARHLLSDIRSAARSSGLNRQSQRDTQRAAAKPLRPALSACWAFRCACIRCSGSWPCCSGLSGNQKPVDMLFWVGAVFVSILVHELGHALAARAYGWEPWITLHGFGGLASYRPTYHSTRQPDPDHAGRTGAGFLFAALIVAGIAASGHRVAFDWHFGSLLPIRLRALRIRQAEPADLRPAVRQHFLGPGQPAARLSARRRTDRARSVGAGQSRATACGSRCGCR